MKRATLAFLVLLGFVFARADPAILVNSDFSDGHAHWKGDAQDPDSDLTAMGPTTNTAGVLIKMKPDAWNKIYQTFTCRNPKLYYTITYQLSPDYKLAAKSYDEVSAPDFSDVPGMFPGWSLSERYWHVIVPGTMNYGMKELIPNEQKKGQQVTMTGLLSNLTTDYETVFVMAFPPGSGTITLYQVALSVSDPNTQP